jgi:catechol 2,3-dioxygenase-like lactoylglutathione lyase family enzyme
MEQRISLVTLGVTDLARARAFYEALGWAGAQQPDDEVCGRWGLREVLSLMHRSCEAICPARRRRHG